MALLKTQVRLPPGHYHLQSFFNQHADHSLESLGLYPEQRVLSYSPESIGDRKVLGGSYGYSNRSSLANLLCLVYDVSEKYHVKDTLNIMVTVVAEEVINSLSSASSRSSKRIAPHCPMSRSNSFISGRLNSLLISSHKYAISPVT